MRLVQKKSGRFTYLYAIKSYRAEDGKSTTKVVEKFGIVEELQESLGGEDPVRWAEERVAEMNAREKADKEEIVVKLKPGLLADLVPRAILLYLNDFFRCHHNLSVFMQM